MLYFVNAPPSCAVPVPDDFDNAAHGPGYLVHAPDAADAVRIINAYRRGEAWALSRDIRIVGRRN